MTSDLQQFWWVFYTKKTRVAMIVFCNFRMPSAEDVIARRPQPWFKCSASRIMLILWNQYLPQNRLAWTGYYSTVLSDPDFMFWLLCFFSAEFLRLPQMFKISSAVPQIAPPKAHDVHHLLGSCGVSETKCSRTWYDPDAQWAFGRWGLARNGNFSLGAFSYENGL